MSRHGFWVWGENPLLIFSSSHLLNLSTGICLMGVEGIFSHWCAQRLSHSPTTPHTTDASDGVRRFTRLGLSPCHWLKSHTPICPTDKVMRVRRAVAIGAGGLSASLRVEGVVQDPLRGDVRGQPQEHVAAAETGEALHTATRSDGRLVGCAHSVSPCCSVRTPR